LFRIDHSSIDLWGSIRSKEDEPGVVGIVAWKSEIDGVDSGATGAIVETTSVQ
jgi:hypothetical protein